MIDVLTLSNESLVILEYSCVNVGVRLSKILMYGKMMLLGQFKFFLNISVSSSVCLSFAAILY